MCLIDLAILTKSNRANIWRYLTGRSMSKLEGKMARLFKMSVPDLRKRLGLKERKPKPMGRKS